MVGTSDASEAILVSDARQQRIGEIARFLAGPHDVLWEGDTVAIEARISLSTLLVGLDPGMVDVLGLVREQSDVGGRPIFLDIETTGLTAGAATLVILVGLGFVVQDELVVRQYVLHEPASERALLTAIARLLADFSVLVTFNGKRFDVPLLSGRFNLHRLADPFPSLHLDLLHPARRIWRRRLRQSNLATLEARVLGIAREGDILGEEVPRRYFAFLRDGDVAGLKPVLDHNRQDIISMACLAGVIDHYLRVDHQARPTGPSDLLGLGSLFELVGRMDGARQCYEAALPGASPGERAEALVRLATLAVKARDVDRAIQLFDAASRYSTTLATVAAIEAAKLLEHKVRQPDQALLYAQRALALAGRGYLPIGSGGVEAITRRVARLEQRLMLHRVVGQ